MLSNSLKNEAGDEIDVMFSASSSSMQSNSSVLALEIFFKIVYI